MPWLILIIVLLVLFIIFLVFRLYTINVSLHDTVYALLNQVVILRDNCWLIMNKGQTVASDLRLYSFFSQGDMGDLMIKRHRMLLNYVDLVGSYYPKQVGSWSKDGRDTGSKSRAEILFAISRMDQMINKWVSFNMHTVTMYTISMVDKIFDQNYEGSLLAVKGFLSVVH